MPAPWNFCSACLLAKSDHIGGDRFDLLSRGHVIPLGPAPWNEIRALSRLPGGMLNTPSEGSIVQRDEPIPLGIHELIACKPVPVKE
jgi:hypothetical protein